MPITFSSIIDFMKTCPYSYLGPSNGHYYARLVGFITGYVYAVRHTTGDMSREVMPQGFNDFVKSTLNSRYPSPIYGADDHWSDVILKEAGSDEAASHGSQHRASVSGFAQRQGPVWLRSVFGTLN